MNTFLLAALCLLGTWAALAGGVTVQVSPVPTLVQPALCPQCTGPVPCGVEHPLFGAGVRVCVSKS